MSIREKLHDFIDSLNESQVIYVFELITRLFKK